MCACHAHTQEMEMRREAGRKPMMRSWSAATVMNQAFLQMIQNPPAYDAQANGAIEKAVDQF